MTKKTDDDRKDAIADMLKDVRATIKTSGKPIDQCVVIYREKNENGSMQTAVRGSAGDIHAHVGMLHVAMDLLLRKQ
jgi:hypothetical protein